MRGFNLVVLLCFALAACVTNRENYIPAGFNTAAEARAYVPEYLYYAKKLTANEWDEFYRRFPEYWKDVQSAKRLGSTLEYHPWYTAYAFKWNTLRRRQHWDTGTVSRLDRKDLLPGDDVFQTIFAIGPPGRVIWDNDFEVLAYSSGNALIFENGLLSRVVACPGCDARYNSASREGMQDSQVIAELGLKRPAY